MKIMTKLNLLSIGIIVVMTVAVLGAGTWIINDILYGLSEKVLRLELDNARKTIVQELNRSGVGAATATAEELGQQLKSRPGLRTSIFRFILLRAPLDMQQDGLETEAKLSA